MTFRPIILIEHGRFNSGETFFDHQPDLTQTINQDITGYRGGQQKEVSFVVLLNRIVPYLRRSTWTAVLLDGINVTALDLMTGVTWQLGQEAIGDGVTLLLAVGAIIVLFRFKLNSAWLVLGGGIVGLIRLYMG